MTVAANTTGASTRGHDGERPTALVIAFSDLARDPRVSRQLRFLSDRYRVVAAGTGDPGLADVRFIPVAYRAKSIPGRALSVAQLLTGAYDRYYWRQGLIVDAFERLRSVRAAVVVANDLDALPLALEVAAGAGVVFDAHEYAPQEWGSLLFRVFFQRYRLSLCRRFMPRAAASTTVCESIAELYETHTGVRPEVLFNAPDYEARLRPREPDERRIRLVHHGIAGTARKLELMIEMMDHLDERFELDLLLTTPQPEARAYLNQLRRLAADKRVRFLDPVPMRELPRYLNQYDIGVFLLPPTNVNYRYALPNKFFEFVQARLAVAVGPSPEMARIVNERGFGIVAEDFTARTLARRLAALDAAAIMRFKERADAAARDLSAEQSRRLLLSLAERTAKSGEVAGVVRASR